MDALAIGSVVVVSFPFSNLKGHKMRPALVVAKAEFDDLILCQITSNPYSSKIAIELAAHDFEKGSLPITSYIRPDKIFTADKSIIRSDSGLLSDTKILQVKAAVRSLFR